jgi:hypothetical protein
MGVPVDVALGWPGDMGAIEDGEGATRGPTIDQDADGVAARELEKLSGIVPGGRITRGRLSAKCSDPTNVRGQMTAVG